jgi:hypothetical membrane protein
MDRSRSSLGLLLGGISWILTLLYFVGQIVAQAAWTTHYSLIDNRVSDLGSTACGTTLANTYICSPLHTVMNATFVLTGLLILVGLFLTRSTWPRRRLTTWGLVLMGIAGLGTIVIGLSPENVNVLVHLVGALNIPAGNVAMIFLGLAIWPSRRGMAWLSLLSGIVGLLGLLAGPFLVILTGHGGGLAERIALYPLIIWLIVFGAAIVTRKLRARDDQELRPIQNRHSPAAFADAGADEYERAKRQAEITSRASAAGM